MIEKLSGEYIRGYTKAIQDVTKIFEYIIPDLKHHHLNLNNKRCLRLLQVILEHREKLRDEWNGFIRYNCKLNDFEYYKLQKSSDA